MTRGQANSVQREIDWVERLTTRKTQLDHGDLDSWAVDVYVAQSGQHVLRIRDATPITDLHVSASSPSDFPLPLESAQVRLGERRTCPTCGAEWENITSGDPTWVARGYEG